MLKKIFLFTCLIILSSFSAYSYSVDCEYKVGVNSCEAGKTLFHAFDSLSSNVRLANLPQQSALYPLYNYSICCSSSYGEINFETKSFSESCSDNAETLMYFTNNTNARIAINGTNTHHTDKLCVSLPDEFASMDLKITNDLNYENYGYECIFRTNSPENGHVSACDETFAGGQKYEYTAWIRMFESIDSLNCNTDCTSKLDNRVYSACGQKLGGGLCSDVPPQCDGSLLGGWVHWNSTSEVQCVSPWKKRSKVFSEDEVEVKSSDDNTCTNLITKKYSVLINNEIVSMNIYICDE